MLPQEAGSYSYNCVAFENSVSAGYNYSGDNLDHNSGYSSVHDSGHDSAVVSEFVVPVSDHLLRILDLAVCHQVLDNFMAVKKKSWTFLDFDSF